MLHGPRCNWLLAIGRAADHKRVRQTQRFAIVKQVAECNAGLCADGISSQPLCAGHQHAASGSPPRTTLQFHLGDALPDHAACTAGGIATV